VLLSAYFGTTLSADNYTIATGEIFYLGTGTGDASANHLVNGLTNVDHCYVECLEINSGRCLSFRSADVNMFLFINLCQT